MTTGSRVSIFS